MTKEQAFHDELQKIAADFMVGSSGTATPVTMKNVGTKEYIAQKIRQVLGDAQGLGNKIPGGKAGKAGVAAVSAVGLAALVKALAGKKSFADKALGFAKAHPFMTAGAGGATLAIPAGMMMNKNSSLNDNRFEKIAGSVSEVLGAALNPLNVVASPIAALAALISGTRTDSEMNAINDRGLSNFLAPGLAQYNLLKRLGWSNEHFRDRKEI